MTTLNKEENKKEENKKENLIIEDKKEENKNVEEKNYVLVKEILYQVQKKEGFLKPYQDNPKIFFNEKGEKKTFKDITLPDG
jgi:hypothetical protein